MLATDNPIWVTGVYDDHNLAAILVMQYNATLEGVSIDHIFEIHDLYSGFHFAIYGWSFSKNSLVYLGLHVKKFNHLSLDPE